MPRPLCSATTAAGKPCRNRAIEGADLCSSHLGRAHRPSLLTDEVAEQLVSMLRAGAYVHVAARAAGISRQTFADWLQRGQGDAALDEPYRELRERVEQARAEGEARNVARIAAAAVEDWRAAAWLLERQYPDRWGRPSTRVRPAELEPAPIEEELEAEDPFREVDELAEARRRRAGV
jgi:hypothetical protein